MKLWLITRRDYSGNLGIFYHSAVVAAETELAARLTHPDSETIFRHHWDTDKNVWMCTNKFGDTYASDLEEWPDPSEVKARFLGEAVEGIPVGSLVCETVS